MRSRGALGWRLLAISASLLAIVLGAWHHRIAFQAIFVFREGEPWTSWVTILGGPMATLPIALLSFYQREAAGYLLILGTVVSLGAFVLSGEDAAEVLLGFLGTFSGPTVLIALALVFLQRQVERVTD